MGFLATSDGVQYRDRRVTLLASAARTATNSTASQVNGDSQAVHVVVDVTAGTSGFSVTPKIEAKDAASGVWYTLLEGLAITATGTTVLRVGPGLTASANATAADYLPQLWRVTMTHADTKSITYTVGAQTFA